MKILFITIGRIESIYEKEIYPDLIRQLSEEGHNVSVLHFSSDQNCEKESGSVKIYNRYLKGIRGNVSSVRKGLAYLLFPIKCVHFLRVQSKYDLVIASTPPVTVSIVFGFLRRRGIPTYLLQKDIFPEDAIDLGVLSKRGIRGLIYFFFRHEEKRLYKNSSDRKSVV